HIEAEQRIDDSPSSFDGEPGTRIHSRRRELDTRSGPMKAGDRVRFRAGSKAWRSHGVTREAQGIVVEIYRAAMRGELKVDVRFGKDMKVERGIDIEELE